MSKLKEADFYYGAVISTLINNGICPMLIESNNDRQIYEFTTNQKDFWLFLKYRSIASGTKRDDYSSWQFTFSASDISELQDLVSQKKALSLGLICGTKKLIGSEYAVLHKKDVQRILDANKTSLTISRRRGEKAFRISMGGGRDNAMLIRSNRVY